MTPEEINHKLATELMGWVEEPWAFGCGSPTWSNEYFQHPSDAILEGEDPSSAWQPTTDRNHLALCLGAMPVVTRSQFEDSVTDSFHQAVREYMKTGKRQNTPTFACWLLTAAPETIARAILNVIDRKDTP